MTGKTSQRGVSRSDAALDVLSNVADHDNGKRKRAFAKPAKPPAPDCGCYHYLYDGVWYVRCKDHGKGQRCEHVVGQCSVCVAQGRTQ